MNNIDILDELKDNFLVSSLDTNMGRAFPNVGDGLKPGQRCCLWEMYTNKYLSSKPHVKSAKISGGVIGKWWPHSDVAIYETFARMSQPFINNIPEVDFHGSNGNIILGGDAVANQRYTEARLAGIVEEGMFNGIDKDTVDMTLNFTEDAYMPTVLPAVFPRLLVNGCQGIGVSIANMWLPHNFSDTAKLIKNYVSSGKYDDSWYYPDFPTGGTIINKDDLYEINKTGKGKVIIQAKYDIKGQSIYFTEMPYQVYIEPVIEQIKDAIEKEKISGISEVSNRSDKKRILLVIECKRGVNVEHIVQQLFSETDLQKQYNANQNGIKSKTPILLTTKEVIDVYIEHNTNCIKREHEYDMKKASERLHILDGLLTAMSNIDNVIHIIRKNNNPKEKLMKEYSLDEEQVKAILDMKLSRLAKLEVEKLEQEQKEKKDTIKNCEKVINSFEKQKDILIARLDNLVKKYGDKRRTEVVQKNITKTKGSSNKKEFVPESVVAEIDRDGYVKMIPIKNYRKKNNVLLSSKIETDDLIMIFTSYGKVYRIAAKNIKQCSSSDKGTALGAILKIEQDEKVLFASPVNNCVVCDYICFASSDGQTKKTDLIDYSGTTQNLNGMIAMKLKNNAKVIGIEPGINDSVINLKTKNMQIAFMDTDLSLQGKTAAGVKGINLSDDDEVVFLSIGANKKDVQKRGGKGRKLH